jgi:hypothetical protein
MVTRKAVAKAAKKTAAKTARKSPGKRPAKAAGRTSKPTTGPAPASRTGAIRVRMYRVGFGDFFLMTVPGKNGPAHMEHPRFHAHLIPCDRCAFRRGVERSTRPRLLRVGVGQGGA